MVTQVAAQVAADAQGRAGEPAAAASDVAPDGGAPERPDTDGRDCFITMIEGEADAKLSTSCLTTRKFKLYISTVIRNSYIRNASS